jgi:hypothetical protein
MLKKKQKKWKKTFLKLFLKIKIWTIIFVHFSKFKKSFEKKNEKYVYFFNPSKLHF